MISILETSDSLKTFRQSLKGSLGFVPTMGNLHDGHLSLLERALSENDHAIMSIFVNPKQFGPNEDFARYPRTFEADAEKIQSVAQNFPGKSVGIFHPKNPDEVFPKDEDLHISVTPLNNQLEGALRPGHFDGVATVVYKLFRLTNPTIAYFGLKDFQQYLVIKKMVQDLGLPLKIQGMPIKRDETGLALSSRNQYLSSDERTIGLTLSQTLLKIKEIFGSDIKNIEAVRTFIENTLKDSRWNYLELRDSETFSLDISHSKNITALGVFQLGTTRLLDNLQMEIK